MNSDHQADSLRYGWKEPSNLLVPVAFVAFAETAKKILAEHYMNSDTEWYLINNGEDLMEKEAVSIDDAVDNVLKRFEEPKPAQEHGVNADLKKQYDDLIQEKADLESRLKSHSTRSYQSHGPNIKKAIKK